MTKLVIQHREIEAQIKSLQSQLAAIEKNPEYLRDIEFVARLDSLLSTYGKGLSSIRQLLDPEAYAPNEVKEHASRGKPRKAVTYRNPFSNEILVTAGGNNKILKQWKIEYPDTNIKDWIVGDQK